MKNVSNRQAIGLLIASTVIFTAALVLFCYALGLDFTNEGWSTTETARQVSSGRQGSLIVSLLGFAISIIAFFVGLHRVAKPQ